MRTLRFPILSLILVLVVTAFLIPPAAHAGVFLSVGFAPPVFPMYAYYQPPCPGDGYMWTPGYWGWQDDAYVWMPGAWMMPPFMGALWTPGYWGWGGGFYNWHEGYWGRNVGYYGGVNYGGGYYGRGYEGGYWHNNNFMLNRNINNVGGNMHNVYNGPAGAGGFNRGANGFHNGIQDPVRGTMQNRGLMQNHGTIHALGATQNRGFGGSGFQGGMHGTARPLITANHSLSHSGFAGRGGQTLMASNRMPQSFGQRGFNNGGFRGGNFAQHSFAQQRGFGGGGFNRGGGGFSRGGGFSGGGFHGGGGGSFGHGGGFGGGRR